MKRLLTTSSILLASAIGASAASFYGITEVATNMVDGNPGGNPVTNIAQGPGAGFDAAEPHDGPSATWYTDAPGGFPSDYIDVHAGPEYIWLDLGADSLLGEISYWGYSTGNANGMREFNVSFATDAEGGAGGLGDEAYGTSITDNPAFTALQDNVPRQSFNFSSVTARYVRVEATSTYFGQPGAGAGGDRLGIGEIAFEQIPEPSAAMLSLLAGTLLFRRRRR